MFYNGRKWGKVVNQGIIRTKMFFGEFEYKINEKGRMPIPPRFRRELKERVVLTPRVEKYITAYPLPEWKKLAVCSFLARMRFNRFKSESAVRQQR